MTASQSTALLLYSEVQQHRIYFYENFIRPHEAPAKIRGRQSKNAKKQKPTKGKNYIYGQDVDIPFTVSHENQEDYLHKLDPTEWKSQDQYMVLGLGHRRYRATEDEIKKAYKRLILKHHPDKRRQKGEAVLDETKDYFACIAKGFDVLGDPEKRKQFDSIDPVVSASADDVPDKLEADEKHEFYQIFGEAFKWNSRWSNSQPVPQLGDDNVTEEYLDEFYDFWYNFDSWRDFSFLDEPITGEDRYERRAMEKQNKEVRKEKKSKEMARIRKLVDNAFVSDPRIAKLKDEEKRRKEADRQARLDAQRAKKEAEEQEQREILERQLEEKRIQDENAKAEADRQRKEREAEKKLIKKERKTLRDTFKTFNYFAANGSEQVKNLAEGEKLCDALSLTELQEINENFSNCSAESGKVIFDKYIFEMNKRIEDEKAAMQRDKEDKDRQEAARKQQEIDSTWNDDELKLLIKAVNLYPAGTGNRWEVVAQYINHHMFVGGLTKDQERKKKTAKDVIAKSKNLKQIDQTHEAMKNEANKKAFDQFSNKQKPVLKPAKDDNTISERYDENVDVNGEILKPWTATEQQALEQAMRKFPASDPQRWENIAKEVQTRSKDECLKRYKELVEKIKAQKAAAAKTAK